MKFSYAELVGRNLGFFTEEEQNKMAQARIFIPGVGGMGGAAIESLVRMGVCHFVIADGDVFEISNMNRQVFCDLDSVGLVKAEATKAQILRINPEAEIAIVAMDWPERLHEILPNVDFVINGCDDMLATIKLMRAAKQHQRTVIDALASTFPNVLVVHPHSPRPEEFFGFPTVGRALDKFTPDMELGCRIGEVVHVLAASTSARHVVWKYAREVVKGQRKRFSLSTMVITTGNLMAYEAMKLILGQASRVDHRGVFWNPWLCRVERPAVSILYRLKSWLVRRALLKQF